MEKISLSEGSGGREMHELIAQIRSRLGSAGAWKNIGDDSASLVFDKANLLFTTDSYVVSPLFFPGGNIGDLAFCGTVNDLAVMGARPQGLSLGLVLEEGLPRETLWDVVDSIGGLSKETGIPVVTGDTKVMEKGAVDGLVVCASGVGSAEKVLDGKAAPGDKVIVSGGIGEHGAALLAKRFGMESALESDCRPLLAETDAVRGLIKSAKDLTRGGLAACLNETSSMSDVRVVVDEEDVPVREEVSALSELLGIDCFSLACEGRFAAVCSGEHSDQAVKALRKFNKSAAVIGEVTEGKGVEAKTRLGRRILSMPSGDIVPRIC